MRTVEFMLEGYEDFGGWEHMPKKELFSFAVNPFTGRVFLKIADTRENGPEVIERVLNQVNRSLHLLKMEDADANICDFADVCDGKRELTRPHVVSVPRNVRGVAAAGNMAKVG